MEIGKLRHRVTITRHQFDTVNNDGTVKRSVSVATLERWARVEPLTAQEIFDAQRQSMDVTHRFILRPVSVPTDVYRDTTQLDIEYDGRTYEVVSLLESDDLHNQMTTILAKRRWT